MNNLHCFCNISMVVQLKDTWIFSKKKIPKFIHFGIIREQSRFSLHFEFFTWFSFNDKSKTYLYRHFKTQFEIQEYIVYLIEMKHYLKCWCAEEDLNIYIYGRCKIWGVTLANVLRIPTGSGYLYHTASRTWYDVTPNKNVTNSPASWRVK